MELARRQHAAYVSALEQHGVRVTHVPTDPDAADCCFIEDTAVVWQGGAIITRPGAPARRRELTPVEQALCTGDRDVATMSAPAQLDGGDVLRCGSRLLVGLSMRSNEAGAEALRAHAAPFDITVDTVRVSAGLHLKSAITLLDATTLLLFDDGSVEVQALAALDVEILRVQEREGANVLALGRHVLVSAAARSTIELVSARGFEPVVVDISEMHRGDGALTCLSLREPPRGAWCV